MSYIKRYNEASAFLELMGKLPQLEFVLTDKGKKLLSSMVHEANEEINRLIRYKSHYDDFGYVDVRKVKQINVEIDMVVREPSTETCIVSMGKIFTYLDIIYHGLNEKPRENKFEQNVIVVD